MNADSRPGSTASARSYQGIRNAMQSGRHRNEIAQRHHPGSRLSKLLPTDRDQVETVTSALTIASDSEPPAPGSSLGAPWPETPPGADPLPRQLDRWLPARGAELAAVRRPSHSHPGVAGQGFETAPMAAPELSPAVRSPRVRPT